MFSVTSLATLLALDIIHLSANVKLSSTDSLDHLLKFGGHIGDGVRPSERRKGIATRMIALGLEECKKLGITRVLMTCKKENTGSAKSIMNNGGILENEIEKEDGTVMQRYWITL